MSAVEQKVVPYDPMDGIIEWGDGMEIKPGNVYAGLPNALYHGGPGISKSGLDNIRRSPMHFQFLKENPKPSTPTLVFGSALHCLVLEGEEQFHKEYTRMPSGAPNRPTSRQINAKKPSPESIAAIEFWKKFDAENEGKIIISTKRDPDKGPVWGASDWDTLFYMRDSVMSNPNAAILFSDGIPELSAYWVDKARDDETIRTARGPVSVSEFDPTFRLCKLRMDWWNYAHNIIVDLKTTNDASYTAFAKSCVEYRYFVQDAYYRHGMMQLGRPVDEFIFVAVEKEPPYAVCGYVLDKEAKQMGRSMFRQDMETYQHCKLTDDWPGYQDRDGKQIRDLFLPGYAFHNVRIF